MRRGWLPTPLSLFLVVVIVTATVPTSSSLASHGVDLANVAPTGWSAAPEGTSCPTSLGCDDNDGSGIGTDVFCENRTTHGATRMICNGFIQWTRTSGVTSFELNSFRVLFRTCQGGLPNGCTGDTLDMISLTVERRTGGACSAGSTEYWYGTQAASPIYDTGEVSFDSPVTIVNNEGLCFNFEMVAANTTQTLCAFSIEAYGEVVGPTVVPITDYLYDLEIRHPPFERIISWSWRDDACGGSWSIVDQDNDVFGGDFLNCAGEFVGDHESFTIQCPVVCLDDIYTITINDTGRNRIASYEISSTSNGQLLPDILAPVIQTFWACYNATTDQCVALSSTLWTAQAAGTLQVNYTWFGSPADATIGHDDPTQGLFYMAGTPSTLTAQAQGNYRRTFTAVDETLSPVIVLYLENEVGQYAWLSARVDFGSGGQVEVQPGDPAPDTGVIRDCNQGAFDLSLIACRLGQLLDVFGGFVGAVASDVWSPLVAAVRAAALEKLPFAYVVMASDGVGAQLAEVAAEIESSDDCSGVTLNVPLYYGTSPLTPDPTNMPVVILRCEDLEPFMGTTWYQAIRTAIDPALWLLFAWGQFKSLQPKPSLNG